MDLVMGYIVHDFSQNIPRYPNIRQYIRKFYEYQHFIFGNGHEHGIPREKEAFFIYVQK